MSTNLIARSRTLSTTAAVALTLALTAVFGGVASASHNGAVVNYETGECGETTFTTGIADPNAGHKVSNMYLVVSANGNTQYVKVPIDGSTESLTAGPFTTANATISWNVFGGGERDYDQPLWNGYGGATFNADIAAYAANQGGYSWVLDGPEEPNPFVNWNEVEVEGCPVAETEEPAATQAAAAEAPVVGGRGGGQPVGGVSAGGGGASSVLSPASLLGLLGSAGALGLGLWRGVIRFNK